MSNHNNYPQSYSFKGIPKGDYPLPIIGQADPIASINKGNYQIGQFWINQVTDSVFMLVDVVDNLAVWALIGAASGDVSQLTGDSGTALPVNGNIDILGTADQIETAGASDAITLSLSDTLVAPGSVEVTDGFEVVAGAVTIASGTDAISISADAAATTIAIGTGAAAKTVTVGSTNTTSATTIASGSGGIALTGQVTASSNVILNGSATQLRVQGGAVTDFIGTATLVLGTVTVANTNIAAGDRIFIQRIDAGISTTLGELSYTISAGASFTITSLILGTPASPQTADVSTVAYFIVREI